MNRIYHSGETEDARFFLNWLRETYSEAPTAAVGLVRIKEKRADRALVLDDTYIPPELDVADLNQVEFTASGKSIRVGPAETVHAAAAKLGLLIPKACGMGICGTCKVLKLGGEVEMDHNGGITDEDVAEGYILSCCSVPKGDVRIEF